MSKNRVLSFKYLFYDFTRITAIPGLLWFRPKKIYLNEEAEKNKKIKGGALLVSNHIGLADPMYLMLSIWRRRHHFIAMSQLFEGKFKRWLFTKAFLCIEINRENFTIKSFKNIVNHLKDGELVTMFPEGHVNVSENSIDTFKSGMVVMALKSGCPIIPVYIKRRKHFYSRLIIGVGEPINIAKFSSSDKPTLEEIDKAAKYLQEVEHKLEVMCNEEKKKDAR